MALSESALQKLGLNADADDSAIEEAINTLADKPTVVNNVVTEPSAEDLTKLAEKFDLAVVDKANYEQLVADARSGAKARAQQVHEANDRVIADALNSGKISPASKDTWRKGLEENRDGTLALLSTIPANSAVPVHEIGYGIASEEPTNDAEMAEAYAKVVGRPFGKDA